MKGPDECWPWLRCIDFYGRGVSVDGNNKTTTANRVAYQLAYPSYLLTANDVVCYIAGHSKRAYNCVNPRHLELKRKTFKENLYV